jgi:hypothetical protein
MEATQRLPFLAAVRPTLRALGAFAGLVTGLFWIITLALVRLLGGAEGGVDVYLSAVQLNWTTTIIPSLVVPGLHYVLAREIGIRAGRGRERIISVALALLAWPFFFLHHEMRELVIIWGLPLALLLGLYGWYRGGMVATDGAGTRTDRVLENLGVGVTSVFVIAFVVTVGWAWTQAMLRRG